MSADGVRGPRHAAPRKPLLTRLHVPSGKAMALAAMPTAVLMGMGFTPTLALADGNDGKPTANSLTVDEYQACLEIVEGAEDDASASPTPSASASGSASPDEESSAEAPGQQAPEADQGTDKGTDKGASASSPSSDSGSDDEDEPAPVPSASAPSAEDPAEPDPTPSKTDRSLLEDLGDALEDVFAPKGKQVEESPAPSASTSASASEEKAQEKAGTAERAAEAAEDTVKDVGDKASEAVEDAEGTEETVGEAAGEATAIPGATASPSPSASATVDPEDCPVATDAEGGVDNELLLPEDPWTLNASSLTLKGASYKGIVEVRTASGATKRVLKYVISDGTDIGDLHQTVTDKRSGATHHVQAAEGSTSTIRDGDTVMYTESISGNLLGQIPVTFDPEHPPPLDIPRIHFTEVTVKQAGQFGGTLHVPGLRQYITV